MGQYPSLISSSYIKVQVITPTRSIAPKKDQVTINEKNVVDVTIAGQSSTRNKIIDLTPCNGSNSTNSTKINLKYTPFATFLAMIIEAIIVEELLAEMAKLLSSKDRQGQRPLDCPIDE
ncbi:UNVERIFIED_CONTAM: hypothetical protein Sindi_0762000 [Sesamum indicum]